MPDKTNFGGQRNLDEEIRFRVRSVDALRADIERWENRLDKIGRRYVVPISPFLPLILGLFISQGSINSFFQSNSIVVFWVTTLEILTIVSYYMFLSRAYDIKIDYGYNESKEISALNSFYDQLGVLRGYQVFRFVLNDIFSFVSLLKVISLIGFLIYMNWAIIFYFVTTSLFIASLILLNFIIFIRRIFLKPKKGIDGWIFYQWPKQIENMLNYLKYDENAK